MTYRPSYRSDRTKPIAIIVFLIFGIVLVSIIVNAIRAINSGDICDAYPEWTAVKDLPASCLSRFINDDK